MAPDCGQTVTLIKNLFPTIFIKFSALSNSTNFKQKDPKSRDEIDLAWSSFLVKNGQFSSLFGIQYLNHQTFRKTIDGFKITSWIYTTLVICTFPNSLYFSYFLTVKLRFFDKFAKFPKSCAFSAFLNTFPLRTFKPLKISKNDPRWSCRV